MFLYKVQKKIKMILIEMIYIKTFINVRIQKKLMINYFHKN